MSDVKIKLFDSACMPTVHKHGDWIDLHSEVDVTILPGEFKLIPLGVAMKLPKGYEAHIVPRSSTYKNFHIIQTNHCGIVDNSYCGPNDKWLFPALCVGQQPAVIKKGDRICQFRIFQKQPEIEFVQDTLEGEVDRGGFGSTGKN